MSTFIKDVALESLPQPAGADHSTRRGFFVEIAPGGVASVCNATTDLPYGCITDGERAGGRSSVALCGGNGGTVRVKTSGAVSKGARGQLAADGTVIADSGAGPRTVVCRFCEDGISGELVEAILLDPRAFTS